MDAARYLSTRDLAARLNVSPRTVELMRADLMGPAYLRVGSGRGQVRYTEQAIEEWEAWQATRPTRQPTTVDEILAAPSDWEIALTLSGTGEQPTAAGIARIRAALSGNAVRA